MQIGKLMPIFKYVIIWDVFSVLFNLYFCLFPPPYPHSNEKLQKRHRYIEHSFGLCGGGGDDLGEWY